LQTDFADARARRCSVWLARADSRLAPLPTLPPRWATTARR